MLNRYLPMPVAHRAVVHGDTIYLAGMVADDKSLSLEGQTKQALEKIDVLLRSLGSDATRMLSAINYVTDIASKDELNAAWTSFFERHNLPARATVGVAQLGPGTLIEIVAIAAAGPGGPVGEGP